jgi:protein SCO1
MRVARLVLALLLVSAGAAAADEPRPDPLRAVSYEQRIGRPVPLDLGFRDEDGRAVVLRDYFGRRPVVLVPAYYRCTMLCPLVLNGVVSALRALPFDVGKAFDVVTVSFNPAESSADAAKRKETSLEDYRRPDAASGWHFLTGDETAIRALTDAIGFRYTWDEAHQQYAHAAGIVVLTPDGTIARYFYGVEFAPRDLRLALVEASAGKLGSPVDQLLLFCFHYDPASGKYGATVMSAVRAGGALTLLGLGTFLVLSWRREARRS